LKNKKSTYYRLFRFSYIIVICIVLLFGIAITFFSTMIFKKEKFNEIQSVSDIFISIMKADYASSGTLNSAAMTEVYNSFSDEYDIDIYLYDENGNCITVPQGVNERNPLSQDIIKRIDKDSFADFDTKTISSKQPSILYGDRFSVKYGDSERMRIYLTAYSSTESINSFTIKLVLFFTILGILILILSYRLMRRQADKYTSSAEEFRRVCEKFAKSDFSERINIQNVGTLQDISKHVNVLADNAANSDETSKTFIANVSHELRTPMTTIGGFVDGILDGTIPKSKQNEYLVLVSKEIKRLKILISSMLSMSRFESGTLTPNFKETNLTDLVIQTVLMFEKKINDKNLEIEGLDSDRLTAVVDADLMQQVIYNLVENAVKFVDKGGTISFGFEKNKNTCTVSIKNTGEGLKNSEIQQVFDRFYKTDSSRGKDTTGLGLGLSISRKIVHIHKGHIIVKSVYGEYTEFSVEIPEKQN